MSRVAARTSVSSRGNIVDGVVEVVMICLNLIEYEVDHDEIKSQPELERVQYLMSTTSLDGILMQRVSRYKD